VVEGGQRCFPQVQKREEEEGCRLAKGEGSRFCRAGELSGTAPVRKARNCRPWFEEEAKGSRWRESARAEGAARGTPVLPQRIRPVEATLPCSFPSQSRESRDGTEHWRRTNSPAGSVREQAKWEESHSR
jgi:hypothetical protein